MIHRDPFGTTQMRGHRRAGVVVTRREERHYVATAVAIAAIVVAAAGAGYGAYAASEAQQQQASAARRTAKINAANELAAGQARAAQIQYNADKMKKSFLSREAGAGVQVGQGSLLETEGQFAFDTEYSKQLARYPHELAGYSDKYQSDLFGWQKKNAAMNEASGTLIAGVAGGASAYRGSSLATTTPTTTTIRDTSEG